MTYNYIFYLIIIFQSMSPKILKNHPTGSPGWLLQPTRVRFCPSISTGLPSVSCVSPLCTPGCESCTPITRTSLTCAHQNDSLAPRFMYTYLHVQKQPFRLGLGDLGLGGDLGTRRQGVGIKVYINIHKQTIRLGLGDLGLGGDLGTRRQGVGIKAYINKL